MIVRCGTRKYFGGLQTVVRTDEKTKWHGKSSKLNRKVQSRKLLTTIHRKKTLRMSARRRRPLSVGQAALADKKITTEKQRFYIDGVGERKRGKMGEDRSNHAPAGPTVMVRHNLTSLSHQLISHEEHWYTDCRA